MITLDRYYSLSELQTIVLYPTRSGESVTDYTNAYDGRSGPGLTIELQKDNTSLYSATITEKKFFYRFDGNADFSTNMFTPTDGTYSGTTVIGDSIRNGSGSSAQHQQTASEKIVDYSNEQQVLLIEDYPL